VLLAVVVAFAAPLRVTVAPFPAAVGLIVPEIVKVGVVSLKSTPVTSAPLTVVLRVLGLNVMPVRLGATV
jgi:hypothetical protein